MTRQFAAFLATALAPLQALLKRASVPFGPSRWALPWTPAWPARAGATLAEAQSNAAVMACVRWIARTFPEAPTVVEQTARDGTATRAPDHPLQALLDRPNGAYSGLQLWTGTLADYTLGGNAYWFKARSAAGRVVALWWLPAVWTEPRWPDDGSAFISHYEYATNGQVLTLPVADVVHFRDGFDPANIRKGQSPLGALLREVATDDEAARFTATILHNLGVPGVVISPGAGVQPTQADLEEIKATYQQRFSGAGRGEPLVLRGPADVKLLSFSPEQLQLRELRRIPEERITAMLGIPAVVVGLGAGLDRSTYSNMAEAREAAYESGIIPLQRLLLADLNTQLVADFGDPGRLRVRFDYGAVRVLQEDQNAMMERATRGLLAGGLTLDEFRALVGQAPLPRGRGAVLYVPATVTPTAPDELAAPLPAPVPAPASLRALPEAARHRPGGSKGAAAVAPALLRAQARALPACQRDVGAYLAAERNIAVAALYRDFKAGPQELDDGARLAAVLGPHYQAMLDAAHAGTQAGLGVAFGLPDPAVAQYTAAAGEAITGITATTRTAVQAALAEGAAAGESIPQLAARLRALAAFGPARAETIARTELGDSQIRAALTSYDASGVVVGVEILDGDSDPECAARHGRRLPLAAARTAPRLLHPRCVGCFSPLVDAADLEGAA